MDKKDRYNIFDFTVDRISCDRLEINKISKERKLKLDDTLENDLKTSIIINEEIGNFKIMMGISMKDDVGVVVDVEYSYLFKLKNRVEFVKEKFAKYDVLLLSGLISVSYSTFRGNFYEKLKSSVYSEFTPIPIINVKGIAEHQLKYIEKTTEEEEEEE